MDKIKDIIKRLRQKPQTKKEQRFQIKVLAIILAIIILIVSLFYFLPKIEITKPLTGEEGKILPSAYEVEEEELERYTDKFGTQYLRTDLYSLGASFLLPEGWKVESDADNSALYITGAVDYKKNGASKTGNVEVCLVKTRISSIKKNGALYESFRYYLNNNFKYHNTFSFNIVGMEEIATEEIYSSDKKVYVNKGETEKYVYLNNKEDIDGELYELQPKYIGTHKRFNLDMREDDGSGNYTSAKPYNDFYFTYSNNTTGIMISALGANNYSEQVNEIAKTIANSIDNYRGSSGNIIQRMISFDGNAVVGNLIYPTSSQMASSAIGVGGIVFTISNNYKLPEYGIKITVCKDDNNGAELDTSLNNYTLVSSIFSSQFDYKQDLDWTKEENKIVTSLLEEHNVTINGVDCKQIEYESTLKHENKNILEQVNKEFPFKNIVTFIPDTKSNSVYAINISFNSNSESAARAYYDVFMSKVSI